MTLLTEATDVFAASKSSGRCIVAFLAKRTPGSSQIFGSRERDNVLALLRSLQEEGWLLSVRAMFDPQGNARPFAFDTGFAHDVDVAGAFEAPSISDALLGTVRLNEAGWSHRFATEWLLGPREFATVVGGGEGAERPWGFLALWEWNDAWSASTEDERRAYDAECDVAFAHDLSLGINIAGRHRLDWASRWHHIGIWESPSVAAINAAMRGHEAAADFKFTTSRHFIGPVRPFAEFVEPDRVSP
jgi:hypothetical protein